MSSPTPKIVAIGFQKKPASALPVQQYEALYIYGVLSQLARFAEIQYRDLATLPDKISLSESAASTATYQKLQQICQTTRTHYLLTGSIIPLINAKNGFTIQFKLYDLRKNQYVVEDSGILSLEQKHVDAPNYPNPSVAELNGLINQTVCQLLKAITGKPINLNPEHMPVLSSSLNAMQLSLKAHQTSTNAEKIMLYEAAIREDLQLEVAYYHLARIYKSEYQYEKSVLYFRETLKVSHAANRNKALYATEAGISCALLGRLDLALQWWKRAVEYDPTYINPYFNIANIYEDQEQYAQAEHYFLKAQELAPDDFRTFFNLARIYSKMGVWEKALTQYRFQLATEGSDPWCHSDVATCYLNLGDLQSAKHHLEKTLVLDPEGEAGQYAQLILVGLE